MAVSPAENPGKCYPYPLCPVTQGGTVSSTEWHGSDIHVASTLVSVLEFCTSSDIASFGEQTGGCETPRFRRNHAARVYEKIVEGHSLYKHKVIRLPRPEFFVLYNGTAPCPDEQVLKLSDMYESTASLGLPEKAHPALELEVKMLNINQGRNIEIAQRCKTLAGYSAFVMRVREYERAEYTAAEAIKEAVLYCQRHDILKGFLEEHGSEVLSMLMTEWNWDDALAVRYEEGHEDGWEGGLEEGLENVARNALAEGFTVETVQRITGLDIETIESLKSMQ